MQAYKFDTRVSETGIISLPHEPQLFNMEVEIIVIPKTKIKRKGDQKKDAVENFIEKYSGCLKNLPEEDPNDLRYEYLKRKYQLFSNDISKEEIDEARYKYLMEKHK